VVISGALESSARSVGLTTAQGGKEIVRQIELRSVTAHEPTRSERKPARRRLSSMDQNSMRKHRVLAPSRTCHACVYAPRARAVPAGGAASSFLRLSITEARAGVSRERHSRRSQDRATVRTGHAMSPKEGLASGETVTAGDQAVWWSNRCSATAPSPRRRSGRFMRARSTASGYAERNSDSLGGNRGNPSANLPSPTRQSFD
jgi:hypothetical protein